MSTFSEKKCIDCQIGIKLSRDDMPSYLAQISDAWKIKDGKLFRHWDFENFKASKAFVDIVSELAESEGHHPDIAFSFKYVDIVLYTHKAGGITEADFILASKIDRIS